MEVLGLEWVPVIKDWRLNERSYGNLVGKNKKECVASYGKDLVKRWRRSWLVYILFLVVPRFRSSRQSMILNLKELCL